MIIQQLVQLVPFVVLFLSSSFGISTLNFLLLCIFFFHYTGTPFWRLVLKQFYDLLVKILIASAVVSFLLALINGETGLSAFEEPSVSSSFSWYFWSIHKCSLHTTIRVQAFVVFIVDLTSLHKKIILEVLLVISYNKCNIFVNVNFASWAKAAYNSCCLTGVLDGVLHGSKNPKRIAWNCMNGRRLPF